MKVSRPALLLLLVLLGFAAPLRAQAPAADSSTAFSVTLDRAEAALGDRVVASYSARIPAGSKVELEALVTPAPNGPAPPGGGAVLEYEKPLPATVEKTNSKEWITWRRAIAFAPFSAGTIRVPGPHFVLVHPNGERLPVRPPDVSLLVSSRLPASQKTEALSPKGDRPTRVPPIGIWFYGSLALAALLLTAFVVWLVRRRRGKSSEPATVPELPAGAELLAALSRLEKEADGLGSDGRAFYSSLTHAVKRYLERRLAEPVLEWTTFETIRRLRDKGIEFPRTIGLAELLTGADQVKFGKAATTREDARRHIERARLLHAHLEAQTPDAEAAGPSSTSVGERS